MLSFRCALMFLFISVASCGVNERAAAATNLLLSGAKTSLNMILPHSINAAGYDPYVSDFEQEFRGPSLSLGPCGEGSIDGALHSINVTGLSSARISDMKATSATSNFFMTRVDAPTRIVVELEHSLTILGNGEISAKCSAGPFGSVEIAKADMRTASHVKGVSILMNVTLSMNLITSTFKSAHVDSVHTTLSDVDTLCSFGQSALGGLDGFCSAIDNEMTSRLRLFFEGPLSARMKDALQNMLDSTLPFGPGAMSSNVEPRRLVVKEPPLVSPGDVLV